MYHIPAALIGGTINKLKLNLLKLTAFATMVGAPLAIVISCGGVLEKQSYVQNVDPTKLNTVSLTGDSHDPIFHVPRELTNVDESNRLSAIGDIPALAVYGRTTLKLGSVLDERLNNNSFMPLNLLSAYLRGDVYFVDDTLWFKDRDSAVKSVLTEFKLAYGFTKLNAIKPQLMGAYAKDQFELRYQPLEGFSISPSQLSVIAKPNVDVLKTYVNLDSSLITTKNDLNMSFRNGFVIDYANSNNGNLVYVSDLTINDLPGDWSQYVKAMRFSTVSLDAPANSFSLTRPTRLDNDLSQRNLFMLVEPRDEVILMTNRFDITTTSNVRNAPQIVDQAPLFAALDLTNVIFSAQNGVLNIDETRVALPTGTSLQYRTSASAPWKTKADFTQTIVNEASVDFTSVEVHLISNDVTTNVVLNDKRAKPNVSALSAFVNTRGFFISARTLIVDQARSTFNSIFWLNVPAINANISDAVSEVQYLIGDYATSDAAMASNAWTATLPRAIVESWSNVNVWVRLKFNDRYVANTLVEEITASSQIKLLTTQTDVSALVEAALALKALPASRHNNVLWTSELTIPSDLSDTVERIEFLNGLFTIEQAVNASSWVQKIPTSFAYDHDIRKLYVRFVPKNNAILSTRILDLTTSSGIKTVRSLIDASLAYANVNFDDVELLGNFNAPVISGLTTALPTGSTFGFRIDRSVFDAPTGNLAALKRLLMDTNNAFDIDDLATLAVQLVVTDNTKYVLDNDKITSIDVSNFDLVADVDPTDLNVAYDNLTVNLATSTSTNVIWNAQPNVPESLSNVILGVEFLSGKFATAREALAASSWSTSLPTTLTFNNVDRYLWMRYVLAVNYEAISPRDITLSSKIRDVATQVPEVTFDALFHQVRNNTYPRNQVGGSTHDYVIWSQGSLPLTQATLSTFYVDYLSGNYVDEASAKAASASAWSSDLPRAVAYDQSERHLWLRLSTRAPYTSALGPQYYDLSIAVRDIRSKVDLAPGFADMTLSTLEVTGSALDPSIIGKPNLVTGLAIEYQIAGERWASEAVFFAALKAKAGLWTHEDFNGIRARFVVSDISKYVLVSQQVETIISNNLALLLKVSSASIIEFYQNLNIDPAQSTPSRLAWSSLPDLTPFWQSAISKFEFLIGNFASAEEAAKADSWVTFLPEVLFQPVAETFFWIRLAPNLGYEFESTIFDHTTASRIRLISTK